MAMLGDAHLIRALRRLRDPLVWKDLGEERKEKVQWLSASCVYVGTAQKPQSTLGCSEAPDFAS